jgi:replicative superfamily II helicase
VITVFLPIIYNYVIDQFSKQRPTLIDNIKQESIIFLIWLTLFSYILSLFMIVHLLKLTFLGKDVLAKAKTGTGKTVAFLVILLNLCLFECISS